ncbi:MAG: response regulator [Ignavibacteria bacterium]|nr:response regulator [Ignavibacteria bacterium]
MKNIYDIILIEDNPSDLKLTLKAFEKINLANRVFTINDGETALKILINKDYPKEKFILKPKVILLDLMLPKIHGLEILKELKSNPDTKIIPVIVLTSSRDEIDIIESYKLGANSYIVKPVEYEKFVQSVDEIGIYWYFFNVTPEIKL